MVSVMILDVGQNCDFKPTHRNHIQNHIKTKSKSYQKRIKNHKNHKNPPEIDQKTVPGLFLCPFLKPTRQEPWKRRSVPKPYQNHIKITSKTFQNHI